MRIERCPFCGNGCVEPVENRYTVQMQCEDCMARGPITPDDNDAYEKAIVAWNRRKNTDALEEIVQFAATRLGGAGPDVAEFERMVRAYYDATSNHETSVQVVRRQS